MTDSMRRLAILCVTLVLVAGASACASKPASPEEAVSLTVQLRWLHQAQFAGFYVADQLGLYAEEELTVSTSMATPSSPPMSSWLPILT